MQQNLEKTKSIDPDAAFSIYDKGESGLVTKEDFKRILRIFFGEVLHEQSGDYDFILRLTQQNGELKILYREFCKFLSKRFVRTFKHVQVSDENGDFNDEQHDGAKTAMEQDLDRPIHKEATL